MKILTPAERLIVAADFRPIDVQSHHSGWVKRSIKEQVLTLADELKGTGVYFKVNSALRACGYELIDEIHQRGLRVFADLKLYDIVETLSTDGVFLREAEPELLTAVCSTGMNSLRALKVGLPHTEVLGVTILTSMSDEECSMIHGYGRGVIAFKLAELAKHAGLDGIICSAGDADVIRKVVGTDMTINTPAIRPIWSIVPGDDQNPRQIKTPSKAILAGADRIIVGRPITQAEKPYDAVMRTLEEIASVTT